MQKLNMADLKRFIWHFRRECVAVSGYWVPFANWLPDPTWHDRHFVLGPSITPSITFNTHATGHSQIYAVRDINSSRFDFVRYLLALLQLNASWYLLMGSLIRELFFLTVPSRVGAQLYILLIRDRPELYFWCHIGIVRLRSCSEGSLTLHSIGYYCNLWHFKVRTHTFSI
jgi:hypothetical protein